MKFSLTQEGRLSSCYLHESSTKSGLKSVFSIKGTLCSVVMCTCVFDGKAEKRGAREGWGCNERT